MPTFVAFTDHHRSVESAKKVVRLAGESKAEFLVCGGDFSEFERNWEESWEIIAGNGLPIFIIAGNHESPFFMREVCVAYPNCQWMNLRAVRFGAVQLMGLDGTSDLSPHDGEDLEGFTSYAAMLEQQLAPALPSILVTHYPPKGTACCGREPIFENGIWHFDETGKRLGSVVVRKIVERLQPSLVLCGHFHDSFGAEDLIGKSRILNPGPEGMVLEFPGSG